MRSCLIGSTGFVGTNLRRQVDFDVAVHRPDVWRIAGESFDLVVCAGAPAEKWRANAAPEEDLANIEALWDTLGSLDARALVLVSTVDVFGRPCGVDEDAEVDGDAATPYGRHRQLLEARVRGRFPEVLIARLPGVFGPGLKKNLLFDLQAGRPDINVDRRSRFQWYDVRRLWQDLEVARGAALDIVHLATPPLRSGDVAAELFSRSLPELDGPIPDYDMTTKHAASFGGPPGYVHGEQEAWERLRTYVTSAET